MKSSMNFQSKKNLQGTKDFNNRKSIMGSTSQKNTTVAKMEENTSLNLVNPLNTNKNKALQKSNANNFKNTNSLGNNGRTGMTKEPQDLMKSKELIKRVVLTDSEDRWFLNPQYKIEMKPSTKLIITLLQSDEKISNVSYQKCNFMIIMTKVKYFFKKNFRINFQEFGI